MQLISIRSIPIEYQIQMERPRLEVKMADNPIMRMNKVPLQMNIRTRDIQVQLDTTEMRRSMGIKSVPALISEEADKGMQAAQSATAEMSRFGTQTGQIQDGVTIAQLVTQKLFQQPDTITTFIPSVGPDISWIPAQANISVDPGSTSTEWEVSKNVLSYVPGKFQMIIKQYPKVQIEYLGQPNYVPPSAAPNYEDKTA